MPISGEKLILAMSQIGAPATPEEIAHHLTKRSKQKYEVVLNDVTATITGGVLYKFIDCVNGYYFNRGNIDEMLKMLELEEMDEIQDKKQNKKLDSTTSEYCSCVTEFCTCSKNSTQPTNSNSSKKETDSSNSNLSFLEKDKCYDDSMYENIMNDIKPTLKKPKSKEDLSLQNLMNIQSAKIEIAKIIDEIAGVIECQHKNSNSEAMKRVGKKSKRILEQCDSVRDALEIKQNYVGCDLNEVGGSHSDCMPSSSKRSKLENSEQLNIILSNQEVLNSELPKSHKMDNPNSASTSKQ